MRWRMAKKAIGTAAPERGPSWGHFLTAAGILAALAIAFWNDVDGRLRELETSTGENVKTARDEFSSRARAFEERLAALDGRLNELSGMVQGMLTTPP
jgi:hypothetical protein